VVLVTGAAGDIGRAACAALVAAGYDVVGTDIIDPGDHPIEGEFHRLDTTSAPDCRTLVDSLPRLDAVVANAGIVQSQPFLEIDPDVWRRHLEVNTTGAFVITQAGARRMVADGTRGCLIYTSSWVASNPWPEIAAYASSKAAIDQLMRQAALELAGHGIRANSVAPGIVRAGMARRQLDTEPAYAARAATAVPLGELQSAEHVAGAIAFLASDAAATMTGSVLLIDAGCSLGGPR